MARVTTCGDASNVRATLSIPIHDAHLVVKTMRIC